MTTRRRWQFDGVVRFTRIGTAFIAFTVVIGFAAINTGNNSLYIGFAFMLGCLLLSGVASKGGLKHLRVDFESVDEAWAGRPARGRLRVANRSPIWNVRDVLVVSDELGAPILLPLIPRRSDAVLEVSFLFERRGLVQLQRLDLYTRYPFGFFFKKRRVRIDGEVVVYPRLLDEETGADRFRSVEGEQHPANRPGPGSEIHSFRDFVRGDSLRHVYWKKSASLGRWIIKQTELDSGRAVHMVVDPYKPPSVSADVFERMVSEAATFLNDSLRRDLHVILSMPHVTLRSDREGSAAMFRSLALLQPGHQELAQAMERNSIIFTARSADERQSA